jgi:hypothetical protein
LLANLSSSNEKSVCDVGEVRHAIDQLANAVLELDDANRRKAVIFVPLRARARDRKPVILQSITRGWAARAALSLAA